MRCVRCAAVQPGVLLANLNRTGSVSYKGRSYGYMLRVAAKLSGLERSTRGKGAWLLHTVGSGGAAVPSHHGACCAVPKEVDGWRDVVYLPSGLTMHEMRLQLLRKLAAAAHDAASLNTLMHAADLFGNGNAPAVPKEAKHHDFTKALAVDREAHAREVLAEYGITVPTLSAATAGAAADAAGDAAADSAGADAGATAGDGDGAGATDDVKMEVETTAAMPPPPPRA